MDSAIDLSDASKALDLNNIRFQLIRLEDTITFHLIERVQFPLNTAIYTPSALPLPAPHQSFSFLDWTLYHQESLQSQIRRYQSPDEYPFFPTALLPPILPPLHYPSILHPNTVNINPKIKELYITQFLPGACKRTFGGREERREDVQENYGSAATADIAVLQALSRRIHFGKFVAESKFLAERGRFEELIRAEDRRGIDEAITNEAVERKVLERLRLKAKTYGMDPSLVGQEEGEWQGKIDVDRVVDMYREIVIPLTKEVEVEYLMQRLD